MRKLAKVDDDEVWLVKKAVYGLRAAPKAWERARDQKLNNAVLTAEAGHELGDLRLVLWDITEGLWRIVQASRPDVILGVLAMYVDDGLLAGVPEVVQRAELKSRGWNTFNGTKSLPVVNEGHYQQQTKDELHTSQLKDVQSQVGALLWIALRTRPDLAAAVGITATLMSHCPGEALNIAKS